MSSNSANNSDNEDSRPKWSLNPLTIGGGGKRKSAFQPYNRPQTTTTVLTNLQRGNTEAPHFCNEISLNFHERAGQGELTEEQIKAEVNQIDFLDKNEYTPLHWACYYGQISSVNLLINAGADVNKLAPDMVSPLHLAAAGGHHEVVRSLIQNNANTSHMDIVGNTALMYAAAGNHPHTCNELLSNNPDITVSNENGDTAYSLAVENNATLSQGFIEHYLTAFLSL